MRPKWRTARPKVARRRATAGVALALAASAVSAPRPASASAGSAIVARDAWGIPHVFAPTPEAAAYGAGYAVGEDRLWQAIVFRAAGRGELASLLGPDFVGADRVARTFGPTEAERRAQLDALPADLRRGIEAYARGLSRAMEEALGDISKTPIELLLFGITPRPWTATDSIAVIGLMSERFGGGGGNELRNLDLLDHLTSRLGAEAARRAFDDMLPADDPDSPTSVPSGQDAHRGRAPRSPSGLADPAAVRSASERLERMRRDWERARTGLGLPHWGSNAWVVSGARTETGRPLLYGGPQMGQSVPQIALELGFHTGGTHVYGMTFAGAGPGIPIGAAPTHAWTTTSGLSDVVDTYVEELDPDDPFRYRFRGEWRSMECRDETIEVRGAAPVPHRVCRTVHGPVVAPDPATLRPAATVAFTQRTSFAGREAETGRGFFELMEARNVRQAAAAAGRIPSSNNVLYATASGDIAYWHVGAYPVRPDGFDTRLPYPGTGEAEWGGFVPFEDLPQAMNPPQGWIANWNNKPAAGWPNGDAAPWGALNQVQRLFDLLEADDRVSVDDAWSMARDAGEVELRALPFRPLLLEARRAPADARAARAVELVASWDGYRRDADGDRRYDAPGYTIFIRWWEALFAQVFDAALGPHRGRASPSVLWRVLAPERSSLEPAHDWLGGRSPDEVVMAALTDGLGSLAARFGTPDPDGWLEPVRPWVFQPIGVGRVAPIPYAERGTYQQAVAFVPGAERDRGLNAMAPGQSGLFSLAGRSPHFDDQRELYAAWGHKPMPVTPPQVRATSRTVLVVR